MAVRQYQRRLRLNRDAMKTKRRAKRKGAEAISDALENRFSALRKQHNVRTTHVARSIEREGETNRETEKDKARETVTPTERQRRFQPDVPSTLPVSAVWPESSAYKSPAMFNLDIKHRCLSAVGRGKQSIGFQ